MLCLASLALAALSTPALQEEGNDWTVYADTVYTVAGEALEDGRIQVTDGKIAAVTPGKRAASGKQTLHAAAVTPGMIDASVRITVGAFSVEQSSEQTAGVRAAVAVDIFDERWAIQARKGVTSALACPQDQNVIGGMAAVLKTAGDPSLSARLLAADAVLRGAMGTQPSRGNSPANGPPRNFYARRPTTRMGCEWVLRKSFYDAFQARGRPERAFAGMEELQSVLEGRTPFAVQAWTTQDIRTTVFLKEEIEREGMGSPRFFIDAGAEAWKEPDLLVRSKTGVVLPPFSWEGRTTDSAFMATGTAALLHERGVLVALSAHGRSTAGQTLDRQAGFAMRGGLSFEAALAAVTLNPATLLGVDDRVGTIEAGKDADLVLWSGRPFDLTSRVIGVLIDGRLVLDPRPQEQP